MVKVHSLALPILLAISLSCCTNKDKSAANAAADAEAAFQQGRNGEALQSIHKAVGIRDDVSDYWILLARISTAEKDLPGAFGAYENVIKLDRGNVEALRLLCQLGLAVRAPDKVDKYADQLLLLTPGDPVPLVMKGGAALQRGDEDLAMRDADDVLAKFPADVNALILKARVHAARKQFNDAARLIENSVGQGIDDKSRLEFLKDLYTQAHDSAGYQSALSRLAAKAPKDADVQLEHADVLYQTGQSDLARSILRAVMRVRPDDIGIAGRIVDLWLREGPDAVPAKVLQTEALGMSLEMRSAFARYANEVGHPDLAMAIIGPDLAGTKPTVANSDAKSALAYAIGLRGNRSEALHQLDDILEFDSAQPQALMARARLRGADNRFVDAISDARLAVANNPKAATARLVLVELLFKKGDSDLAVAALREGVRANPTEPRLAARLAQVLAGRGDRQQATEVLEALRIADPVSPRAARMGSGPK